MLEWCNHEILKFACESEIYGISDVMGINGVILRNTKNNNTAGFPAMCAGESGPSLEASVQAFKNWATKHPEHWNKPAAVGIMLAMEETWPCR